MLPHFWTTLRMASRAPSMWVLALLGALSTLAGLSLSVLALGDTVATGSVLVRESAGTTAVLAALWLLALGQEVDLRSGFTPALDATRTGTLGRYGGRLVGALCVSMLAILPTLATGALALGGDGPATIYLLYTIISSALLVVSWAFVLLVTTSSSQAALLGGLAIWVAGHLPWGQPDWGGAGWGQVAAALLPGGGCASEAMAACGLLALGASFASRPALRA